MYPESWCEYCKYYTKYNCPNCYAGDRINQTYTKQRTQKQKEIKTWTGFIFTAALGVGLITGIIRSK